MNKIRAAIVGYGNLGRSVEKLLAMQPDMELAGIFSRRDGLDTQAPVWAVDTFDQHLDDFDVALLCTGSATDIPKQAPGFAARACTVETFDNHHEIPQHRAAMNEAARQAGTVAIISTGWDPGVFSVQRALAESILPHCQQTTFWGPGVSQGHSNALRRIDGVKKAIQYTIPNEDALEQARSGQAANFTGKQAHLRRCFVVADESDHERIEHTIRTMPDYFVGYTVEVNFIDEATFDAEHTGLPHGGHVITTGSTGSAGEEQHSMEFTLKLDSNADFTAAVEIAYARAAFRMHEQGLTGAFTVLEVAPYLLSPLSLDELIARSV